MLVWDAKLVRSCVFLCLPTVAAVAFGVYFFTCELPHIVDNERARFLHGLEKESSLLDYDNAAFVWQRGKGVVRGEKYWEALFPAGFTWKQWAPVEGTKQKEMWGMRRTERGLLVWARGTGLQQDCVYASVTDKAERNWTLILGLFGGVIFLVLLFTTAYGVKFFLDYIKSREDFMAAAAHDLTTPLAAMRYFICKDNIEARNLCERLNRLVINIKDFLRLGCKRAAPKIERVDLCKAYEEAYIVFREDYRECFDGHDVPFVRSNGVEAQGPIWVAADETLLVQILWNLLGNDLKYAAPYGSVEVHVSQKCGFVDVEFVDCGGGMSNFEMRKAFDRYYRAKTVLVSGKGGFGIGLPTAKEFAEAMGGSLSVRDNKPQGCIFKLSLAGA